MNCLVVSKLGKKKEREGERTRSNECKKNYCWEKIKMEFSKWFRHPLWAKYSLNFLWKKFLFALCGKAAHSFCKGAMLDL